MSNLKLRVHHSYLSYRIFVLLLCFSLTLYHILYLHKQQESLSRLLLFFILWQVTNGGFFSYIFKKSHQPSPVWLSVEWGSSHNQFRVRAHAWVAGWSPVGACGRGSQSVSMCLSSSFFLPLSLKINKILKKIFFHSSSFCSNLIIIQTKPLHSLLLKYSSVLLFY